MSAMPRERVEMDSLLRRSCATTLAVLGLQVGLAATAVFAQPQPEPPPSEGPVAPATPSAVPTDAATTPAAPAIEAPQTTLPVQAEPGQTPKTHRASSRS